MYLLDAQDALRRNSRIRRVESEFELRARVHLTGALDLDAIYVHFWELPTSEGTKSARAVLLRIRSLDPCRHRATIRREARRRQYYFPEGLPAEVAVLLTLFTRAHFILSRTLKSSGTPIMRVHHPTWEVARSPVDGQSVALGDLAEHFHRLAGLRQHEQRFGSRRVEPFMLAARLYHLALTLREADESLAYVTLVSAIEALLHDYHVRPPRLSEFVPELARMIRQVSPGRYPEIAKRIMAREKLLARRFRYFTLEYLPPAFWRDPLRPKSRAARFKSRAQLGQYLDRIYRARSGALHEGKPFPPHVDLLGEHAEVPLHLGAQVGNKEWKERDLLPSFRAFEHVVHHVLVEYLRREAENGFVGRKS